MSNPILVTERLRLDPLGTGDAELVLELLNEPSFIDHIADRGVRCHEAALDYIRCGPQASYARHGFGLWKLSRREDREPLGLCGLLQRDGLPSPDLGYALLERHVGRGYAREAADATCRWAFATLGLARVLAVVSAPNSRSIRLLQSLGMQQIGHHALAADEPPLLLFSLEADEAGGD